MSIPNLENRKLDVCFLNLEKRGEIPLRVTGACDGINTLAQKVITQMFAYEADPGRPNGTNLAAYLSGSNLTRDSLRNMAVQSAVRVKTLLREEASLNLHDLPAEETLAELSVVAVEILDNESASVTLNVASEAGESTSVGVRVPMI